MTCFRGRRAASSLLVALAAVSLGLASCSSDDSETASTTTTKAPEDIIVPDREVTAGLASLRTLFQSARDAIASKSATVSSYPDQLEDAWFAIEGTIKKNDPASYITFEDALARMNNAATRGEVAEATKAVDAFNTTADAYLAEHP